MVQLSLSPFLCSPCFLWALGFSLALGAWFVTCLFTTTAYMSSTLSSFSFSSPQVLPSQFFSTVARKPVLKGLAGDCGGGRTGRWFRLSAVGLFEGKVCPHVLDRSHIHTGTQERRLTTPEGSLPAPL